MARTISMISLDFIEPDRRLACCILFQLFAELLIKVFSDGDLPDVERRRLGRFRHEVVAMGIVPHDRQLFTGNRFRHPKTLFGEWLAGGADNFAISQVLHARGGQQGQGHEHIMCHDFHGNDLELSITKPYSFSSLACALSLNVLTVSTSAFTVPW